MSNYWLEERLQQEGITLHRAPVGDKYVLERMLDEDLVLGGEQSGHIIFREHATTGDGVLTGLLNAKWSFVPAETGKDELEAAAKGDEKIAQLLAGKEIVTVNSPFDSLALKTALPPKNNSKRPLTLESPVPVPLSRGPSAPHGLVSCSCRRSFCNVPRRITSPPSREKRF